MIGRRVILGVVLALVASAAPAQPRITFMRRIPARYDLAGADEIVILYAIGDNDSVETFVDEFVDRTNRSGSLHLTDLTAHGAHFAGQKPDERTIRRLRRENRADAYMGIGRFTCEMTIRTGEGSATDVSGARVRRKHEFVDAVCRARIDLLDAQKGTTRLGIDAMGEGTSPRVEKLSDEERKIALDSAARYAAIVASQAITPREVREIVELDPTAPYFDRGMDLIDNSRLREARMLWENVLVQKPQSAPLLYNLAAVSEAAGDLGAACDYLERAMTAAPKERRYRVAMDMLRRRNR